VTGAATTDELELPVLHGAPDDRQTLMLLYNSESFVQRLFVYHAVALHKATGAKPKHTKHKHALKGNAP
jgi:hypothetical protein